MVVSEGGGCNSMDSWLVEKKNEKSVNLTFFFYFFWWESNKKSESTLLNPPFLLGVCLPIDLESLLLFSLPNCPRQGINFFFFKD